MLIDTDYLQTSLTSSIKFLVRASTNSIWKILIKIQKVRIKQSQFPQATLTAVGHCSQYSYSVTIDSQVHVRNPFRVNAHDNVVDTTGGPACVPRGSSPVSLTIWSQCFALRAGNDIVFWKCICLERSTHAATKWVFTLVPFKVMFDDHLILKNEYL